MKFAKCYAKLSIRFDQYKQLMFDYDALCFVPDRNQRIMERLEVVRKNLYEKYDQMKRVALNMAYGSVHHCCTGSLILTFLSHFSDENILAKNDRKNLPAEKIGRKK